MYKQVLFNYGTVETVTGAVLKDARKRAGLSQVELAKHIDCHRHSITAWEAHLEPISSWAEIPNAICCALGIEKCRNCATSTRAREGGVLQHSTEFELDLDRLVAAELSRIFEKAKTKAGRKRVPCGARTRRGLPCRNLSLPGKRRCKFHGGLSTGPKTEAGKEAIRQSQKRRWAKWRAKQAR